MDLEKEDYQLMLDLMEESILNRMEWLKSQKRSKQGRNFSLYNAGQIRALEFVLKMFRVDDKRAG